jgi:hypothetical protein
MCVSIRRKQLKFSEPSVMDLIINVKQTAQRRICFSVKERAAVKLLIRPGCSRRCVHVPSTDCKKITTKIRITNTCCEYITKLINFETALTDQNCVHESKKKRLYSGNACCHSFRMFFYSHFTSKNTKIKTG